MTPSRELVLINPCASYRLIDVIQNSFTGNPFPHALVALAALTPASYRVTFINKKIFWRKKDFSAGKLVAMTCLTSAALHAYRLADAFRRAGSKVVLGGPHASAMPEEALQHADSVVIGEAEPVWKNVVADFEAGDLKPRYQGEPLEDFFSPVYDYYRRMDPGFLNRLGLHIDRGCKYRCDFCARISEWCRPVKMEQVLELVKRIKQAPRPRFVKKPFVVFRCDNIFSNPAYAKGLFRKLSDLDVDWGANCSLDMCFDEEALFLAEESGCRVLLIGFETMHPQKYQKTALGQVRTSEDYLTALRNLRRHRIGVVGSFIVGADEDGPADYLRLLRLLVRARLWRIYLTILTPFPGSKLYERLKAEGRIFTFNWTRYNFFNFVFKPKGMSIFCLYLWFYGLCLVSLLFSPQYLLMYLVALFVYQISYHVSFNISFWLSH
ncbi:MAG: cobalamin-dependent protein [Candidatus Omnitrophica bacterium]|nr:cobalamin-dependent protein [Candidatus Omnitrophota bacterium]MDD5573719.1 cobalamin-dependent protein [Candidatus Omnitrophota bacterium]